MAVLVRPDVCQAPGYCGLTSIYEYTNFDGTCVRTNCGQAAAATLLTHHRKLEADPQRSLEIMRRLEREFPPDQMRGYFGTGRRQVERILRAFELSPAEVAGEEGLRQRLAAGAPVIVMLGASQGRVLPFVDLPGGHWMVAYGFDGGHVYLTNGGRLTWDAFRKGWRGVVPWLIDMRNKGITVPGVVVP